jgi:diaminopimelate decarboxylase/aspartate kinase
MAETWSVLKFGGTSVAARPQWETIASLARARQADGGRVVLVCSAVAGMTNRLAALAENPGSVSDVAEILARHRDLSEELEVDSRHWLPQAETMLRERLGRLVREPGPESTASLVAMGEWLSTRIGVYFLQQNLDAAWVDVCEALEVVPDANLSPARRWLSATCKPGPDQALAQRWSALSPVLLTQGFIARVPGGGTALLGRGGSDTSAALLAGRLSARSLEIWTDVPGLFSADPRILSNARLLREVDFAEAQEMAASGAHVVHARSIRAAAETQTPMVIRDINRRRNPGTRIGGNLSDGFGAKTITCQQNMVVLLLQNLDARHEVGFLAQVFDVFRQRGISVDLVTTSETTTTIAVNRDTNHLGTEGLLELESELSQSCRVKVFDSCVCVNLVGRGIRKALARIQKTLAVFEQQPLLMLSHSANDLCLSMLVRAGDHEALLQNAHQALIPDIEEEENPMFGDSWAHIVKQDAK